MTRLEIRMWRDYPVYKGYEAVLRGRFHRGISSAELRSRPSTCGACAASPSGHGQCQPPRTESACSPGHRSLVVDAPSAATTKQQVYCHLFTVWSIVKQMFCQAIEHWVPNMWCVYASYVHVPIRTCRIILCQQSGPTRDFLWKQNIRPTYILRQLYRG